jgi:hypothetical protein
MDDVIESFSLFDKVLIGYNKRVSVSYIYLQEVNKGEYHELEGIL